VEVNWFNVVKDSAAIERVAYRRYGNGGYELLVKPKNSNTIYGYDVVTIRQTLIDISDAEGVEPNSSLVSHVCNTFEQAKSLGKSAGIMWQRIRAAYSSIGLEGTKYVAEEFSIGSQSSSTQLSFAEKWKRALSTLNDAGNSNERELVEIF
jgi:hypothetical protein